MDIPSVSEAVCCQWVCGPVQGSAWGLASAQRTTVAFNGYFLHQKGKGVSSQLIPGIQILL